MSQATTYTCDRCGYTNTSNSGWESSKQSYYTKDYCPSCSQKLLKIGLEAEEANKAKKSEKQTNEIPF